METIYDHATVRKTVLNGKPHIPGHIQAYLFYHITFLEGYFVQNFLYNFCFCPIYDRYYTLFVLYTSVFIGNKGVKLPPWKAHLIYTQVGGNVLWIEQVIFCVW